MLFLSSMPWNPAIITILPSFNSFSSLLFAIFSILASEYSSSVKIPTCHPSKEIVGYPIELSNIDILVIDICSPTLKRASNSLLFGLWVKLLTSPIKLSVVFPCADKTTTTRLFEL